MNEKATDAIDYGYATSFDNLPNDIYFSTNGWKSFRVWGTLTKTHLILLE
jgi:hypothetical protein